MLNHTLVKHEATLLQTLATTGMAGVENGHIVLFCQCVDSGEQAQEVLFRVDVLLPVSRQQDVLALLQSQTLQHVAFLDLLQIHVQDFRHGRAGLVGAFLGQSGVRQILPGKLGIAHIHVRNHIHDAAISLLRAGTHPCSGCRPPCETEECAVASQRWQTGRSWYRPAPDSPPAAIR